mmetsp:Transcript_28444/g.59823  ORF Transcript_28444/g.59823 Transcript_28444/m.59823 type:complete len:295 (-) Transcript_28444:1207-2091(-)
MPIGYRGRFPSLTRPALPSPGHRLRRVFRRQTFPTSIRPVRRFQKLAFAHHLRADVVSDADILPPFRTGFRPTIANATIIVLGAITVAFHDIIILSERNEGIQRGGNLPHELQKGGGGARRRRSVFRRGSVSGLRCRRRNCPSTDDLRNARSVIPRFVPRDDGDDDARVIPPRFGDVPSKGRTGISHLREGGGEVFDSFEEGVGEIVKGGAASGGRGVVGFFGDGRGCLVAGGGFGRRIGRWEWRRRRWWKRKGRSPRRRMMLVMVDMIWIAFGEGMKDDEEGIEGRRRGDFVA